MTFEQKALSYVRELQTVFGGLDDLTDQAVEWVRQGDDSLQKLGQPRRRSHAGTSAAYDDHRRWVYNCAVMGDTLAGVVNLPDWRTGTASRITMLQTLSDCLGVHYLGNGGSPEMPLLRFPYSRSRGSYSFDTRQIHVTRSSLKAAHPWIAVRTVVHERAHDLQAMIMDGKAPSGHLLSERIEKWRTTWNAAYLDRAIEQHAYQSAGLTMLRWARWLDCAPGMSPLGLDSRQPLYGLMAPTPPKRTWQWWLRFYLGT